MTRPRGEIRAALGDSAWQLARELAAPVTRKQITAHAKVGWKAGKRTVDNMVRAGELVKIGEVRQAGVCRPMNTYLPAKMAGGQCGFTERTVELTNAVNSWAAIR